MEIRGVYDNSVKFAIVVRSLSNFEAGSDGAARLSRCYPEHQFPDCAAMLNSCCPVDFLLPSNCVQLGYPDVLSGQPVLLSSLFAAQSL